MCLFFCVYDVRLQKHKKHIIQQCLEKFSSLTHQVSCNLDIFMRIIHDTEFPNSVEATQKLLDEQGCEYERLKVGYGVINVCVCNHANNM